MILIHFVNQRLDWWKFIFTVKMLERRDRDLRGVIQEEELKSLTLGFKKD